MAGGWNRIARRVRVPVGFAFAAFFLSLAKPTFLFLGLSLALVAPGLLLRGYASGYVKKNAELTVTGCLLYTSPCRFHKSGLVPLSHQPGSGQKPVLQCSLRHG